MFSNTFVLYWLLCLGALSPARSDNIEDKAESEVSSIIDEMRHFRKEIREIRKEFNFKMTNILNKKLEDFTKIVQQRDLEIATLHTSVTQLLQHINATMDDKLGNNTCIPITNLTEIVTHTVKVLAPNNTGCESVEVEEAQPPITETSVTQQRCLNYTQRTIRSSCTITPFVALLGYNDMGATTRWNGYLGTIISDRYVLTSAYVARNPEVRRVALGARDYRAPDADWRVHDVAEITVHPEYEYLAHGYDLALLRTDTTIQFSASVQPACLPPPGALGVRHVVLRAVYVLKETAEGDIRTVNIQPYTNKICGRIFEKYNRTQHVCLGSHVDLVEPCDSFFGEPAVLRSRDSPCVSTVVGVVTYGFGCAHPNLYINVSHFVPWLESVVWPEETRVHP